MENYLFVGIYTDAADGSIITVQSQDWKYPVWEIANHADKSEPAELRRLEIVKRENAGTSTRVVESCYITPCFAESGADRLADNKTGEGNLAEYANQSFRAIADSQND